MKNTNRGFIKSLVVVVIGAAVLLLTMAALTTVIKPRSGWNAFSITPTTYTGVGNRPNSLINFSSNRPTTGSGGTTGTTGTTNTSTYSNRVSISKGNVSTAQPYEEYITIRNSGEPVNITGWALTNGKGTRPIQNSGNSSFYPTADVAIIGQGTQFLDPSGRQVPSNIILGTGETAYVTTGGPFTQYSFSIPLSFKENVCTGYLKVYPFTPALTKTCPSPKDDPEINTVTDQCYDYMARLSRCEDPEKDDKKRFDEQTSVCKNFMVTRFNYPSCVADHRYDSDFTQKKWRIFLGKGREMWASRRDTITLYDNLGRIVDQIVY